MNLFLPQEVQTRTELEMIANVKYQIVGAKDSNPIIGCQQDGVTGSYLVTLDDVRIPAEDVAFMLANTESADLSKLSKKKIYTGKEVFSAIIPDGINSLEKKDGKTRFQVKDGNLLIGNLNKAKVASKKNSLIHFVWDKKGGEVTRKFIDDIQKLVLNYLLVDGFTVGFGDCFIDKKVMDDIRKQIQEKMLETNYEITEMENQADSISYDTYEANLAGDLNSFGSNLHKLAGDNLPKDNGFYVLSFGAKAKGSQLNIGKMVSCMSQQSVEGKRPKKRVNGRALTHFHYNDDTPQARGFAANNFLTGLRGHEYFFHSMGGREGLIDTAIKTASTGYIQRRLVKTMEDLMVNYDGTVRNSSGQIIQFIYGDNGIDQTVQADNRFYCLEEDNKTLESKYVMTDKEVKQTKTSPKSNQTYKKEFITLRDKIRESYIEGSLESSMTEGFLLPINLYRMVQDEMDETRKLKYDLTGDYILEQINKILVDPKTDLIAKQIETSLRKLQDENEHLAKQVVKLGMLEYLSPKRCIYEYHLNKEQFDRLIQDIKQSFLKAVVNPGEMVGVIAAQSIGEPCTQMTLNTKHFAGVAGKSAATSGVPRIEEIFGYSKNIKTPIMTMYFDIENDQNEDLGKTITSSMNHITIRELINNVEIYYYDEKSKSELNDKITGDEISTKGAFFLNTKKNIEQFPWLIRLELDREKMLDLEVVLLNIKTRILSYYYGVIQNTKTMKRDEKEIWQAITGGVVLSNLDTSDVPTIHIRLGLNNINFQILTKFLKIVLDDIKLKGIDNISSAVFTKELKPSYDEKTGELLKKKIIEINTAGINMEEVRKYRFIDHNKTYLNDMETIRKYYGMEAVRSFLIIELARTFKAGGVGVPNYAHLSMIADLMTYTGEVVSVDRHGANRVDLDPMARASFERTMDHFVNASIFNEKDKIRATASKIMVGQVIPGGTGAFELVLDTEKLANSEYLDDEYQGRTTFDGFQANPFMEDILQTDKVNVDFLT